jgi:hypothetical protein
MTFAIGLAVATVAVFFTAMASAHDTGVPFIFVGSTEAGGGALAADHGLAAPVVVAASTEPIDGFVLYTADVPSFDNPEDEDAIFMLPEGARVGVEIVARAEGDTVAMKLRGVTLRAVGDSVTLGTAPSLHAHPEWQLTLPVDVVACQSLAFRLFDASDSPSFADSEVYTARLTNDATGAACAAVCGDANGDGFVDDTDAVLTLRSAAGLPGGCADAAACDLDGDGEVRDNDAVNVLRKAAELPSIGTCPHL